MLKAVVDTNIFVSSLLSRKGRPAEILNLWRDALFILVTSPSIISEIKSVLQRSAIKKKYRISSELIDKLILLLEKDALLVPGLSNVSGAVPEDPSDE
ncbi:MAG: putative toxin-antitoxin system toxin component, PIN family, partial [Deltaproteobacteria bacterium]|nr:putative toxin-antitoxin system toxin component, PIN family [Deltaproteobacteria bacterium]